METNLPESDKPKHEPHPFWVGVAVGAAVLVVVVVCVTLLQFFLQVTLGGGAMNTSNFWVEGIVISLIWGSVLGIPLAGAAGFLTAGILWLVRKRQN